jgi:hypothetical protein
VRTDTEARGNEIDLGIKVGVEAVKQTKKAVAKFLKLSEIGFFFRICKKILKDRNTLNVRIRMLLIECGNTSKGQNPVISFTYVSFEGQ